MFLLLTAQQNHNYQEDSTAAPLGLYKKMCWFETLSYQNINY